MAKKTIKDIFDLAVERNALPDRDNYTFRLEEDAYEKFQKICKTHRVSASAVIEEFIKEVVKEES